MTVRSRQQGQLVQGAVVRDGGPLIGQEYFWIHDQTGRTWAWWIAEILMPDWNQQSPKAFDQEVRRHLIPWWIKLRDTDSQAWYVYPEVDGAPLAEVAQPPLGEGLTGSPSLRVRGGAIRYQYAILGGALDVVAG